jgi:flagellar assembly protein FliH
MAIKRRQQKPDPASSSTMNVLAEENDESQHPVETIDPLWTAEGIEQGEVPERRHGVNQDRRTAYRRIEDKQLISKAYEEANAIREKAYEEGFQEGLDHAGESISTLQQQLDALLKGKEEALLSVSKDIAELAIEVATRIIKTEVSCDDTLVMALVKDTIQKAGVNAKSIIIKLHHTDTKTVKSLLKADPLQGIKTEVIVIDDPAVDKGSCIIETNSGLIDASFSTQLGVLYKMLNISVKPVEPLTHHTDRTHP